LKSNNLSIINEDDVQSISDALTQNYPTTLAQALKSKEYFCIIIMVLSSMLFPYFLNSKWKIYATRPTDPTDEDSEIVKVHWVLEFLIICGSLV